eukprot:9089178-Alexandrium_andersonii.AAC.1
MRARRSHPDGATEGTCVPNNPFVALSCWPPLGCLWAHCIPFAPARPSFHGRCRAAAICRRGASN